MIKIGNPKRLVMAGVTLGCALGIGYFMQLSAANSGAGQAKASEVDAEAAEAFAQAFVGGAFPAAEAEAGTMHVEDNNGNVASAEPEKHNLLKEAGTVSEQSFEADGLRIDSVTLTSAEPVPPASAPQPQALPGLPVQLAALHDTPIRSFPKEEATPSLNCEGEIEMIATPAAAAMVHLDLTAPCHADAQFTVHHNGMMFSATTDGDGTWTMQVPALTRNGVFIAAFENDEGAVANAVVDTLESYDRYVLQWQGRSGMQIHAMEYGAGYGDAGHVWRDAARDVGHAESGEGGFLLRLGDGTSQETTLMAEVYTFPTQNALREGDVQVSLEAEVHAANCGRDVEAQALIKPGGGEITARDLTMAIPDCDAQGDFLVLKNLYEDLKIARN